MEIVIQDLDAAGALRAFGDLRLARRAADRDIFVLAGHFADLANPDTHNADDRGSAILPGTDRPIRVAGEGTPLVAEFAIAQAAVELGTTCYSTRLLIGDVLECRHRLPQLYARVVALEVEVWLARKVAQATRGLTMAQAATVDDALAGTADGRVSVRQFLDLLDAAIIAADPEAAAAREAAAATEEFAKVGQTNEHGHKTLYVKTSAAEMVRIEATITYLADALKTLGDTDSLDRRRTKAVLILANPLEALKLMRALATHNTNSGAAGGGRADGPVYDPDDAPLPDPVDDDPESAAAASAASAPGETPDDSEPAATDADTVTADGIGGARTVAPAGGCTGCACGGHHNTPAASDPPPHPGEDSAHHPGSGPDPDPSSDPGTVAAFLRRFHPHDLPACPCRGGTYLPTWEKLLPTVTLYLHLDGGNPCHTRAGSEGSNRADSHGTGSEVGIGAGGVCRWEGEGPISASYVREFLGPHARFDIRPVIDLAHQTPSLAYEVRGRLREAIHLRTPGDVFPYATNTSRNMDIDHTDPFQHDGNGTGSAAGSKGRSGGAAGAASRQTRLDNLGPTTRFHHRVKTHAPGWAVKQPFPGIYLWKAPHGSIFLVDHTGTRQIRRPQPTGTSTDSPLQQTAERSRMTDPFWDYILAA